MKYAIWNNKGGVGKTFLSFILSTEYAQRNPNKFVIVVDMCPQANLSEIILGGNGDGSARLNTLIKSGPKRSTIGGYIDQRISQPHGLLGYEADFMVKASDYNKNMPPNLYLIAGDPSLELQAQVISQISSQTLPTDSWKNVHSWLRDIILSCSKKLGDDKCQVFIDCNPSFSSYTELSMIAADRLIVPCSSDGSSARAIDNIGSLVYGIGLPPNVQSVSFSSKVRAYGLSLPVIQTILLNRSTQYRKEASKAFGAMFDAIKERTDALKKTSPGTFVSGKFEFEEVPDNHSVSIVCSHLGKPLYQITSGKYEVYDTTPQINQEPLERYKKAVNALMLNIV